MHICAKAVFIQKSRLVRNWCC